MSTISNPYQEYVQRYENEINRRESGEFSIAHATNAVSKANAASEDAVKAFKTGNPAPHEDMFACPDCNAPAGKGCKTNPSYFTDPDINRRLYVRSPHYGRRRRAQIALEMYNAEAEARGKKAYDRVIEAQRKEYQLELATRGLDPRVKKQG